MTTFACEYYSFEIPNAHVTAVAVGMPNDMQREAVTAALDGAESGATVHLPVTACDALLDAYAAWERAAMDGATE